MRIQVLTLCYSAARGGFDDGPLEEFVRSHRVLSVSEHFFCVDEVPHLACVVRWQDETDGAPSGSPPVASRARTRRARPDPAGELDAEQRELFEALRGWRRERARQEGLPAYTLMTDRHLAAVARARPGDLEALAALEGVGGGKARLFGAELLATMQHAAAAGSGDGA